MVRFPLLLAPLFAFVPADDPDLPRPHAHFKFDGNDKNRGAGEVKLALRNAETRDKALVLNGLYPFGPDVEKASDVRIATPKLEYEAFTVALRFKAAEFAKKKNTPLLVGGPGYRWFAIERNEAGNLELGLNNGRDTFEARNTPVPADEWTVVACSVFTFRKKAVVTVNGKKAVEFALPKDFTWAVASTTAKDTEKVWLFTNFSTGCTFKGLVSELLIYDESLTPDQLAKIPLKP